MCPPTATATANATSNATTSPSSPSSAAASSSKDAPSSTSVHRPWWRRGGMQFNEIGMISTIVLPNLVLTKSWQDQTGNTEMLYAYLGLIAASMLSAVVLTGSRTIFCAVVVPLYMASLLLVLTLDANPILCLAIAVLGAMTKVAICMSVCLHRYAAHAAFRPTSTVAKYAIAVLGCLANQGGPLWWASQHKAHHKYCDVPGDPHSAILDGDQKAFSFFEQHSKLLEDHCPTHMDSTPMRILDTFSSICVMIEYTLFYHFGGDTALFCIYTASWLCQTITLWFNVANHPNTKPQVCKASDVRMKPYSNYLPFYFFDCLYPIMGIFAGETNHDHHHQFPMLACRDSLDLGYYAFIRPLELLGIVNHVKLLQKHM